MQDSLPLKLFTIENLLVLEEKRCYDAFAYFLPFSLLIYAITGKNLDINDRVDLLEITAHYLSSFKTIYDNTDAKNRGMQQGKKKCVLFNNKLVNNLLTTIISINTRLNLFKGSVSLNRIGTNPLEHHFGLLRIRSHFEYTFTNFIQEEAKVKVLHEIEKEVIGNIVASHKSQIGETVFFLNGEYYGEKHYYKNREFAYSILSVIGVNVGDNKCFTENAYLEFIRKEKASKLQMN